MLLTFFPESDRKPIDAIAKNYRLRNRDLVPGCHWMDPLFITSRLPRANISFFVEIANVLCCLQRLRERTALCVHLKPDVKVLSGCNWLDK